MRKRRSVHDGGGRLAGLLSTPSALMGPRLLFVFSIVALCILGLVMVYSASSVTAYNQFHNASFYFDRQVVFLVVGVVACAVLAWVPYRFWGNPVLFIALWVVSCALLGVTALGGGVSALGAERSISIAGFALQPAEFAKASVLVTVAALVALCRNGQMEFKRFAVLAAIAVVVPVFLMYKQPDLGSALIMLAGVLAMATLAGVRAKWIFAFIAIGVLYVIYSCITQPYHLERIITVLDPWVDPQGDGYHTIQSLYAFGSGGVFGTGIGLSRQKYLYLPYAHTDFIFSVIGEELGLVGTLSVVVLFALFVYAGLRIARSAPDLFGCLMAGSMVAMIGFQACVNMGQSCGLLPVTGKALPFLSYGGSSLVATLVMCGLVLSVSLHSKVGAAHERRRDNLRVFDGGKQKEPSGADSGRGGRTDASSRPRGATQPGRTKGPGRQRRGKSHRQAAQHGGSRPERPRKAAATAREERPHRTAQVISIYGSAAHAHKGEYHYGQSVYARRHGNRTGSGR